MVDALTRLRQQMRRGAVSTVAVKIGAEEGADRAVAGADDFAGLDTPVQLAPAAGVDLGPALRQAPMPGVFTKPVPVAQLVSQPEPPANTPSSSAQDRLRKVLKASEDIQSGKKEIAAVRALTRLLEAVYRKPGSAAPSEERIAALRSLVVQADSVAQAVAGVFGQDKQNAYVIAQAMESVVGLVGAAWERDDSVDWADVIAEAGADPLIVKAAESMGASVYRHVDSPAIAAERLGISMHGAFWSVYMLGEDVDGITADTSSHVARQIATYVQSSRSGISNVDLHVAWMQGSIRRVTDLFCAEIRARFTNRQAPTSGQIDEAIKVAQEGFEGVEIHAAKLFEISRSGLSRPDSVDAPSRPAG